MRYACEWCGLVFIGKNAVTRWSNHTWDHPPEIIGKYPALAGMFAGSPRTR